MIWYSRKLCAALRTKLCCRQTVFYNEASLLLENDNFPWVSIVPSCKMAGIHLPHSYRHTHTHTKNIWLTFYPTANTKLHTLAVKHVRTLIILNVHKNNYRIHYNWDNMSRVTLPTCSILEWFRGLCTQLVVVNGVVMEMGLEDSFLQNQRVGICYKRHLGAVYSCQSVGFNLCISRLVTTFVRSLLDIYRKKECCYSCGWTFPY